MCAGGPPKPVQPMRVHSRATSPRVAARVGSAGSVRRTAANLAAPGATPVNARSRVRGARTRAYDPRVLARVVAAALCLAVAATLAVWDRDHRRCTGTELELVALGLTGRPPAGGAGPAIARLDDACVDATPLANAAAALAARPSQRATAVRLARRATVREPRTFAAWVGYGAALEARGDPVAAGVAYGRAQRLNPRWAGRVVAVRRGP